MTSINTKFIWMSLWVGVPMVSTQSSYGKSEEEIQSLLDIEEVQQEMQSGHKIRGTLGVVAGVAELAKVGYVSFALDEQRALGVGHPVAKEAMVSDTALGIFFLLYGLSMLFKCRWARD